MNSINQLKAFPTTTCRWLVGLFGEMTSIIPAKGEALLHIRYFQKGLAKTLQIHHQNWVVNCKLLYEHPGVRIVGEVFAENEQFINQETESNTINQDSYRHLEHKVGHQLNVDEIRRILNIRKALHSIIIPSLKTVLFALQYHAEKYRNRTIRFFFGRICSTT